MELDKTLQWHVIGQKLQQLSNVVSHYENSYLPDLYHHTGRTQAECLHRAKEELQAFRASVNDFRVTGHWQYVEAEISKSELCNYLRCYAIEMREHAENWSENVLIVMRSLRECMRVIAKLKNLLPEIDCYNNRTIASRTRIRIS